MAEHKPLPTLPVTSPDLITLSSEARNHRAALIVHFLNDLHDPSIQNIHDGWLHAIEEALDNLGQNIITEDWFTRIIKGKELKRSLTKDTTGNSNIENDVANSMVAGGTTDLKDLPEIPRSSSLQPFQQLISSSASVEGFRPGHLLLFLLPHGDRSPEDTELNSPLPTIGCTFSSRKFPENDDSTVLFGFDDLETNVLDTSLGFVGGTFTLKGINSPEQHHLLAKVLKLAIYTHLSLVLEQYLLADSGVHVQASQPKVQPTPLINAALPVDNPKDKEVHLKARNSILPSSFTAFLSKHNIRYRGAATIDAVGNIAPLDLSIPLSRTEGDSSRRSVEGHHEGHFGGRLRRLSFIGEKRYSFLKGHHRESHHERKAPVPRPFLNALQRVETSKGLLSTSAGVIFSSPKILVDLSEKERARLSQAETQVHEHGQRLRVDERMALSTLLGWDGKDAEGRGMSGILGFLRQQELSVLYSVQVALPSSHTASQISASSAVNGHSSTSRSSDFTTTSTTTEPLSNSRSSASVACGKPRWITYRYYSSKEGEDCLLSDSILDMARNKDKPCTLKAGCNVLQADHDRIFIHGGIKITVKMDNLLKDGDEISGDKTETQFEEDDIEVWESCALCDAQTSKYMMSNGTRLFSFAKYLELLVYSPLPCKLTPSICDHTTPPPSPWTTLPSSRLNIIRHFTTASVDITFTLSMIHDIFEVRMPRLQISRGLHVAPSPFAYSDIRDTSNEKKKLRREIRNWWEGVTDHIDKIEKFLHAEDKLYQKTLPRLPSVDEAYDVFDETNESGLPPPTPSTPHLSPPSPAVDETNKEELEVPAVSDSSKTPAVPAKDTSERLISSLRQNFQQVERSLYSQLARSPDNSLNDVRRAFLFAGKGTKKRLKAWQTKHLGSTKSKALGDLKATEPEWWGKGYHVVPGGNIIVRENDWGSIIAHTLSSTDYHMEMANLSVPRSTSQAASTITSTPTSAFFSVAAGYRLFASSKNQPDPDKEDIVWNEPEQYSAAISRKDYSRDVSSLPSIRDVLSRRSSGDGQPNSVSASRISEKSSGDLDTTSDPVQAQVGTEASVTTKTLPKHDEKTPTPSRPGSIKSGTDSNMVDTHEKREHDSSMKSDEVDDTSTIVQQGSPPEPTTSPPAPLAPPLPPKDIPSTDMGNLATSSPKKSSPLPLPPTPTSSSGFTTTLATGLNNAMKYVLSGSDAPSRFLSQFPSSRKSRSSHLSDIHNVDERPHIKYDWIMGKRIRFACTVYYAKQFDQLRKRCGVHDTFVTSLSRSTNWAAEGGKSKSNFWKTSDDRFIIKTLVNAWNVADLQVLLEHAPFYFQYMEGTASKPTVLAKLMGFYTIEIQDMESGTIQAKTDLLVMENLFYGMTITKKFDLKGIQGRKVKTPGNTTKTLFDGEWIEGQRKTLTLVRPHSKVILRDAIKSDAEFLAKSNIMDYSLLLGVDKERKEIACGLVDTIGSYTFAKTLEYKAKQGLQGKQVTVVPPAEYQERFVNTLEGYFVACPDKWSKPLSGRKTINDLNLLPSVL